MPPSSAAATQRRLRVLLIAPHFSEYTARLAGALATEVDVTVGFNQDNWRAEIDTLPGEAGFLTGFDSFFFTTRRTVLRWLGAAKVLWTLIRRRPDIVHFQETHNRIVWLTEPLARRFAPVVLTIHDPVPHAGRDEAALEFWPQRLAIRRRAALCLAHGDHCLRVLATPEAGGITGAGNIRHGVVLQPGP